MELGSLIGLVVGVVLILVAILITGDWNPAMIGEFGDAPSVMVVLGGTTMSAFIAVKLSTFVTAMKAIGIIFKPPSTDPAAAIDSIVTLANTARKEGVLALEESANNMDDAFLKKGVMLIVDGTDPELVKDIMETERSWTEDRHGMIAGVWEMLATYAPSWGMLGTMVGLILMLLQLDDPGAMGPMLSVALVTTFYGCILANFLCNPIASKLKQISGEEILLKTVLIEGMLSIQAGENPRIIEEKLKSFLAPALRSGVGAKEAGAGGGGGGDE
ncbi:MAG: MotA/TolQ/ExbB proton channel family protein [Defluviitaleaceae bacterium]|nr:MotA/TolQ/ExbB proton channel family protein [Defluviitaleaceae bacterium]MCL2275298.1 MotA/TolQ/ExbB proton channel family protein [Defluviitaleaceae bacterium]